MPRVKVTGYMDISDEEYDPGPLGPVTEEAFDDIVKSEIGVLEDVTFEVE